MTPPWKSAGWMVAIIVAAMLPGGAVEAQQQVGTAAAVNPAAQARGAGGSRTIVMGQSIAHKERIQTTSAGSVQLLFLDKTSMTIGPNSDLAIDEYVYDPATNSGRLAATLSKGVMRFVGGQISHTGNAQITTPNAVVGIRGGVGIFAVDSIFIGFGFGLMKMKADGGEFTLNAGDYAQTLGGFAQPKIGPPPPNFLQSVLANLQSQAGQGGGARASTSQVNQARTNASGSTGGNIATNVQNVVNQPFNTTTQNNAASNLNQTIQTTATQSSIQNESLVPEFLRGFTAGISNVFSNNNQQSPPYLLYGGAEFQTDPARNRAQANFQFANGNIQFGSVDPNLPASVATITNFDDLVGTFQVLLPAVNANGTPISNSNGGTPVASQVGILAQIKPGTPIGQSAQHVLGGTPFCQCEFTRWGFWTGDFRHGGNNLRENIDAFWVAGRQPDVGSVPGQGIATYVGHVAAQIENNGYGYAASGKFVNIVNFGTRTGNFTVSNLDHTNYQGSIMFNPNDPRTFAGYGQGNHERYMVLNGSFFRNSSSQVGEMGGAVLLGGSNYIGGGIFIAKK